MFNLSTSSTLPLWKRIAAFLSFVAVLSALVAPASMLADEVSTGKLGGVCNVVASLSGQGAGDARNTGLTGSRCELCGSIALAPPPLRLGAIHGLPSGSQLALFDRGIVLSAAIPGLPPGRGPPSQI